MTPQLVDRLAACLRGFMERHNDGSEEFYWAEWDSAKEALAEYGRQRETPEFQQRVAPWMQECFGPVISADTVERNHRFLEEALELVQSLGCTSAEAHQLVDYVFGRLVGEVTQEVGGVMVTLAALCLAAGINMHAGGEKELERISRPEMIEKIRRKQASKPKHSPLPQQEAPFDDAQCRRDFETWARSERMILTVDHPPHYAISEVRHAWYAWLAARRAAPSAGAIPADWQLVPKEPTREMQLAGQQRIPGLHELMRRSVASFAAGGYPDQEQYWYQPWAFAVVAYKAMLAVAPNPPGGHGDGM